MVEVVNIVASGHFGREFDLAPLSTDLNIPVTQYEPATFPGLQIRFQEEGPVIIIYSTGTYSIMGAKTESQLNRLHERICAALTELDVEIDTEESRPEIRNLICKGDLDREVNLDAFVIELGMEDIEYEPEQSPFVYYWPEELDCLMTIPSNGIVIITGIKTVEEAEQAMDYLRTKITTLIQDEY